MRLVWRLVHTRSRNRGHRGHVMRATWRVLVINASVLKRRQSAERAIVQSPPGSTSLIAKIEAHPLLIGKRPVALEPPSVRALHVDEDRQLILHAVPDVLQPAVEPEEAILESAIRQYRRTCDRTPRAQKLSVRPRTDDHLESL